MPLPMQGSWTVSVKSRELSPTSRFIISGAAAGNGTYSSTAAPVTVTGDAWSIDMQHDPGTGFVDSFFQIAFPSNSGGVYRFDVQSNDDPNDPAFDDLVLTCETPVTANDFVIFGNVSWYEGCIFNPCSPLRYVVLDSVAAFNAAVQRPALRTVMEALYPAEVFRPPVPNSPDPLPFRPLLLPVEGTSALPAKKVKLSETGIAEVAPTPASPNAARTQASPASRVATLASPTSLHAGPVVSAVAAAALRFRPFCETGPLAQYLLRFQDYQQTAAEAAGGPYTGTGIRTNLGLTVTDRRGNYIFRFTLPCIDFLAEEIVDRHIGGFHCIVPLPDVIVQVLDTSAPSGVLYETAPYFNTPDFQRINICVPRGVVTLPPGCVDGQIIQSIGNITVGPPVAPGPTAGRTTINTSLDGNGVITSSSSLGPAVQCAAWGGSLYLYACLSQPDIAYYTISYGRPSDADSALQFVNEAYSAYVTAPAPIYLTEQAVGPVMRNLEIDPGVFQIVPSYTDTENDTSFQWLDRWKLLKMVLTSSIYQTALGGAQSIMFRIQGYRSDGALAADERIILYIDNNGVDQYIDPNLTLIASGGNVSQGNCALFTLPPGQLNAPIQITFRSNQNEGFMNGYTLYMDKGATGNFPIVSVGPLPPPVPAISAAFGGNCSFVGTLDDPNYGAITPNALTAQVAPQAGNWLDPCQTFCAFSISLTSTTRVTDGQSTFGPYYAGLILIGIQQDPCLPAV